MIEAMKEHMIPDPHGNSTIQNVYFDTPSWRFIRASLEKPVYKEKLRIRCYGNAKKDTPVFIERKVKYDGIVYKRRIVSNEKETMDYLCEGKPLAEKSQMSREFDYWLKTNPDLRPAMFISYEREAFFDKEDPDFRVTFDKNILWRDYDLCLHHGAYGTSILNPGESLMELKVAGALPLWMVRILTENNLYKTSFSKYGTAYTTMMTHSDDLAKKLA